MSRLACYLAGLAVALFALEKLLTLFSLALGEHLSGWVSFLTFMASVVFFVLAFRWIKRRILWRLRNRLIVTYVFIGVIPAVLLVAMGLITLYGLGGQFAVFVVTSEFDAQLRTTISPDTLRAGTVFNVIPAAAEAQLDVRRLPNETREEVIARLRSTINDELIEIVPLAGHHMPATEPSGLATSLYRTMEMVLRKAHPKPVIVPYMQRGSTDASWLRQRGIAVYGPPIFLRDEEENRAHAVDERITPASFDRGVQLLNQIVTSVATRGMPL